MTTKIIDRIIAQDGFEHVLSVDYKSRQAGSHNISATQTPLKDIPTTLAQPSNAEMTSKPPATSQVSASSKDKIGRPLSMMIAKAFSGAAEKTPVVEDVPLPSFPFPTFVETPRLTVEKQEKRVSFTWHYPTHQFAVAHCICARLIEASPLILVLLGLVESQSPSLPNQR